MKNPIENVFKTQTNKQKEKKNVSVPYAEKTKKQKKTERKFGTKKLGWIFLSINHRVRPT